MFDNATLNAQSETNGSLAAWQTQAIGDEVKLNPEFVSRSDEFCVQNKELGVRNEELCIKNEEVCI